MVQMTVPQTKPVAEVVDCSEVGIDGKPLALREIDWNPQDLDRLPAGTKLYAEPPQLQPDAEDLYDRLHSLSKSLEGSGRIDEHDNPDAYATVLDAMNYLRRAAPTE